MGIVKKKINGKWRYGVSRRLPRNRLGMKRFRRWFENRTIAKKVLDTLNGAIATGKIDMVLPDLVGGESGEYTIHTFYRRWMDEYCTPRLSSASRYAQSFKFILPKLGSIPIESFNRGMLHEWLEKRTKEVSKSTANKDIAAIKKMMAYACEIGVLGINPLTRFKPFKVQETALRIPTVDEYHKLVDSMPTTALSALVAILGETGMRKSEAIDLTWPRVDFRTRKITLEITKGKTVRSVAMSDYAIEKLGLLIRFIHQPFVFCYQGPWKAGTRIRKPYKAFHAAAKAAGLEWINFHTLRHFRATTWLQLGVDIRTVQMALGHKDIQTTMKYLKFIESHADRSLRDAQMREAEQIKSNSKRDKSGTINGGM
jgi:integrase